LPLVSIIIPVFNSAPTLDRCLRSVATQRTTAELDVIVIDDGSTDDSVEVASQTGIPIRMVRQANAGVAAARNKGIELARGEYLAFLDSDDYWNEEFLSATVTFLSEHPEAIGVSVGQCHRIIGKADSIMPSFLVSTDSNVEAASVLDDFWGFWVRHNHICTGSALMRSDVVRQTGGQRVELHLCEDLEFWAYLATFGKWGFIPRVLFTSDGGAVIRSLGWSAKNCRRWASAPTVPEWERRILPRIQGVDLALYSLCRGRIAKTLAYGMVQSGRNALAYETVANYAEYFPADRVSRLLCRMHGHGRTAWWAMCLLLRLRERARAITICAGLGH
jgi:glycosyltransferase involved in cell wall biosynthesis